MRRPPSLSLGKSGGGLHHNSNDIRSRVTNEDLPQYLRLFRVLLINLKSVKMKFSTRTGAVALSALAVSQAAAEDVLYSRHLAKRQLSSEGDYNISQ